MIKLSRTILSFNDFIVQPLEILWKIVKMLVTGIFSFTRNVSFTINDQSCQFAIKHHSFILSIKDSNHQSLLNFFTFYKLKIRLYVMVWILSTQSVNTFPNKPWILCVCSLSLLKTLWEKEKLLVTSNFSFSQCFLPFQTTHSFNLKLLSFCLEETKICRLGKV